MNMYRLNALTSADGPIRVRQDLLACPVTADRCVRESRGGLSSASLWQRLGCYVPVTVAVLLGAAGGLVMAGLGPLLRVRPRPRLGGSGSWPPR